MRRVIYLSLWLVAIVAVIAVVATEFRRPPIPTLEVSSSEPVHAKQGKFLAAAYGWSTKRDSVEAIREAITSLKLTMGENEPEFVFLFCSCKYDEEAVLGELRRELPNAKVYGGTSCLGILTTDGFHTSENGAIGLMGVFSEKMDFGVGGASLDELSPYEAGRRAILEALRDAGRENELPQLILMTGSVGVEEEVLRGIDSVTGGKVPVVGGSSADDEIKGEWRQFVNDRVYSRGISVAAVFTDLKIALGYEAGYERVERTGVITRATGRVIYEIENQPAAEVYNAWTKGIISQKLQTGGTILRETTFWPLGKRMSSNGKEYLVSIHPLSVDASDHSLSVFANVESGETLQLMYGSWEILLNRAYSTPAKVLREFSLSPGDGIFALYTYCAGTMLAIPEEHRVRMPLLLRASLGNIPFIGTFTFGEQGYLEGVGNVHGNLVNSIVVFTEIEQPFSR